MRYFAYCDRASSGLMSYIRTHNNIRRIKKIRSRYSWRQGHVLLNWGCLDRNSVSYRYDYVLNKFDSVALSVDKLTCLNTLTHHMGNHAVPEYTTDYRVVNEWLEDGNRVFARTKLRASSGNGIVVLEPDTQRLNHTIAPLYTKYVPTKREIRVYIGLENDNCGTSNSYLVKAKRWPNNTEQSLQANLIRSHSNGWVFGSLPEKYVEYMDLYIDCGRSALMALGLDFGAVDIVIGDVPTYHRILEVNTAPGIDSPSTIEWLRGFLNG